MPLPSEGPYREDLYGYTPPVEVQRSRPRLPFIHIVLFVTTFATTAMAGAFQVGADPISDPSSIRAGFPFAIALMTILLGHELGHYFLSRFHGVRATLPYFIPAPPILIGTFGAFIRMKSPPRSRRALFDIGAAGPWVGILLAVPAVIIGLHLSVVQPPSAAGGLVLGDSLLFSFLTHVTLGVSSSDATIMLHPIALAGWFGFFVTFLNLLPMGQLDGGHVTYAMFGRFHRWVSRASIAVILLLGFGGWQGWFVWAILIALLGLDHPPTLDPGTPLDRKRMAAAWLTVVIFILTFMPNPISFSEPPPQFEGPVTQVSQQSPAPVHGGLRLMIPFFHSHKPAGIPT